MLILKENKLVILFLEARTSKYMLVNGVSSSISCVECREEYLHIDKTFRVLRVISRILPHKCNPLNKSNKNSQRCEFVYQDNTEAT